MPAQKKLFSGLSSKQAEKRLVKFGKNELGKKRDFALSKLLFSQFKSPLVYVLVLAGLVTFFLKEWTDSIVIFLAVFLNTILGFYQERKAQKAMVALRSFLTTKAKVVRDGKVVEINADSVVPGDLAILTIGERVPADGALVEATDLSINEAILTGESMPVSKNVARDLKKTGKENRVFMGTMVATGIAKMIVSQIGMETEMGKIGAQVESVKEEKTPLQVQLDKLAKIIALVVGSITLVIFLLGELLGYEPVEMFTTSVAIAVAAIPEGLVVTLTVILALGMQRILKRKALVRKLLAAETLGSVSVICSDKTGTLTEGKMRVVSAKFNDERSLTKRNLVKAAVLCNDLRDPLEVSMMAWAKEKIKGLEHRDIETLQKEYPRIDEIPFSPVYKYIAALHQDKFTRGGNWLFLSGAPEVVLEHSDLTPKEKTKWLGEFESLGQEGYRLVGFAGLRVSKAKKKIKKTDLEKMDWLGVLVYEDPIRKGVKAALKESQRAGIKVKVITGDYASTAMAVLGKLGFKLDPETQLMEGSELENISVKELGRKVEKVVLFARTNPQQKLKIVEALKANGEVVAMSGDGVNDAPALAKADIGIVVGDASDVAKETADMVLLDSNFATMNHAIEGGRTIFENIRKVVLYLLSDGFTEVILIGGALILGLPLPVTAVQILWVNLVEDALPGMALAFEKKEPGLMKEPPRPRQSSILDQELKVMIFIIGILTDLILLSLFYWLLNGFLHLKHIQTVMFVALGINSLFYVYACRSLRQPFFRQKIWDNWFLNFSVGLGLILLLLAVYFVPLQVLLKTQALDSKEWLFLLLIGLFNFLAIEVTKWAFIIKKKKAKMVFA